MQHGRHGRVLKQGKGTELFLPSLNDCKADPLPRRLVHSLIAIDLELSIFHDTSCAVSIQDLDDVQPSSDRLWEAASAESWYQIWLQSRSDPKVESLLFWFRFHTQSIDTSVDFVPEPSQLRSCLHLVIVLLHAAMQIKSGSVSQQDEASSHITHKMLMSWYKLARPARTLALGTEVDEMKRAAVLSSMTLYHILHLSSLVSILDVERVAREGPSWKAVRRCSSLTPDRMDIWVHSAQVLRLLRRIAPSTTPIWRAAAIYRAALSSWAASLAHTPHPSSENTGFATLHDGTVRHQNICLDAIEPDGPSIETLRKDSGNTPNLTRKDGARVSFSNPLSIIELFADELDDNPEDPFTSGIRNKLLVLSKRWNV